MRLRNLLQFIGLACLLLLGFVVDARSQYLISGTVSDGSLAPVPDVDVLLYDDQGNAIGIPPTLTDSLGFYSLSGVPAGQYGLGFEPPKATGLLPTLDSGIVVAGNVTHNVTLAPGNLLSGYVRDEFGVGIEAIDINVYDQATGAKLITKGDDSDHSGFYSVLVPSDLLRVRWRGVSGEPLLPVEIENVNFTGDTTVDVTMFSGFFVSGTVEDEYGSPVSDADLDAVDLATGLKVFTPGDNTDESGTYEILVTLGTYEIQVEPLASDRLVVGQAYGVLVDGDTTLDFTLVSGLAVSGTVRDSYGAIAPGVDIDVSDNLTGADQPITGDLTDGLGQYEIIVPAGIFDLAYEPPVSSRLVPVQFSAVPISSDTTIDVVAPDGLLLSGTVQNGSAVGVYDVDIDLADAITGQSVILVGDRTDVSGLFEVVVQAGMYHVEIEPPKPRRLAGLRLDSLSILQDTTIQIVLDTGVMLSGHVTDSAGNPYALVDVDVNEVPGGAEAVTPDDNSDSLGYYSVVIRTGTYDLLFRPDPSAGVTDSVLLTNIVISQDTTIDVSFAVDANHPPVLDSIGFRWVRAGDLMEFVVTASDADSDSLSLDASPLPGSALFTDHHDGTGTFSWQTTVGDLGSHVVVFTAIDGIASDSEEVTLVVTNPEGCCGVYTGGLTGNCNCSSDGKITLSDITALIDRVYISKMPLCCEESGNTNASTDGKLTLSDISALIDYVYISKAPTEPCL